MGINGTTKQNANPTPGTRTTFLVGVGIEIYGQGLGPRMELELAYETIVWQGWTRPYAPPPPLIPPESNLNEHSYDR